MVNHIKADIDWMISHPDGNRHIVDVSFNWDYDGIKRIPLQDEEAMYQYAALECQVNRDQVLPIEIGNTRSQYGVFIEVTDEDLTMMELKGISPWRSPSDPGYKFDYSKPLWREQIPDTFLSDIEGSMNEFLTLTKILIDKKYPIKIIGDYIGNEKYE